MEHVNTILRAEQSRAEQSRAEQSRAEQSRAEQSRAEQSRAEQSRKSNIELLRVFATIGILFSHATQYMYGGSWWEAFYTQVSFNLIVSMILGIWGQVSVAIFIVISSYFLCDSKKNDYASLIKIVVQVVSLNFMVRLFALILNGNLNVINIGNSVIHALISPISGEYWFITGYIVLVLISPILRTYVKNSSRKQLFVTCCVLLLVVMFGDFITLRFAGSITDFIVLFLVTAYIKKYKDSSLRLHAYTILLILVLLLIFSTIGLNILSNCLGINSLFKLITRLFVNWNIVIVGIAISAFYTIINIPLCSSVINWIAKCSLGIYLLSENSITKGMGVHSWLWCDVFKLNTAFLENMFLGKLLISVGIVYIVCCVIESIRIVIEKQLLKCQFIKKVFIRIDSICNQS